MARFRAGLLELGHLNGHRTGARVQSCVGCSRSVRLSTVHCLVECERFAGARSALVFHLGSTGWSRLDLARAILGARPGQPVYSCVVALLTEIEEVERAFWSR